MNPKLLSLKSDNPTMKLAACLSSDMIRRNTFLLIAIAECRYHAKLHVPDVKRNRYATKCQ
jgi:hypothetical protein